MTEWISVKDRKPDRGIPALVTNEKWPMSCICAIYFPNYDVWRLYDPLHASALILEVTHYIEIPPLPPKD